MKVLVLGGARSGKSTYAESRISCHDKVEYVATAPSFPGDSEWEARIKLHQERRPSSWTTTETSDLVKVLSGGERAVLIDCWGMWLTQAMDAAGIWDERDGADWALAASVRDVVEAWGQTSREVVAVSNEVGLGVVPATPAGRRFRDELGRLNMALANAADEVWLLVAGQPIRVK